MTPFRHYLHTDAVQTARPDLAHICDYDSDEEAPWRDHYEHEKIHDFIDCSPQEKQFMCLWNTFTRGLCPMFSLGMKDILCRFVREYVMQIELAEGFAAFCAHLAVLRRSGTITKDELDHVVYVYRGNLSCHPK